MKKILVIDDEPLICEIVSTYLKKSAEVVKFNSVENALNYLQNNSVDLIISDFYMPECSGLEMVEKLRINKNSTPVLLMSGSHVQVDEISKFTAYIKKPFSPKALQEKVLSIIK
jgi:DNA-binding response OmpR family regulator